jgi:hypothetical protein
MPRVIFVAERDANATLASKSPNRKQVGQVFVDGRGRPGRRKPIPKLVSEVVRQVG